MLPTFPSEGEARHEEGFLNAADHLRLFWQRYTPPHARATVAVLHGGGDHSGRYPALTSALVRARFQVALVDLRGHGQSDGRRWHVDAFHENVSDLDAFVAKLSQDGVAGDQLFLVGHSHGGLVAAHWGMTRGRHVSGFVLSSPYFRLALRPSPLKVMAGRLVGKLVPWLPVDAGLDIRSLTSDEELQRWTERDPLYGRKTTPRWFEQATAAQAALLDRAQEFRHPLLVLAGGGDRIAAPEASRAFADRAGSPDKEFRLYPGLRHELWNEAARDRTVGDAVAWIVARL